MLENIIESEMEDDKPLINVYEVILFDFFFLFFFFFFSFSPFSFRCCSLCFNSFFKKNETIFILISF